MLKRTVRRKVTDTSSDRKRDVSGQEGPRTLNKDAIKALRKLIEDFEDQLQCQNEGSDDSTSEEEQEEEPPQEMAVNSLALFPNDEEGDEFLHLRSHSSICVMIGFSQWQR